MAVLLFLTTRCTFKVLINLLFRIPVLILLFLTAHDSIPQEIEKRSQRYGPYWAVIKKGAPIYNSKDKSYHELPKDIYIQVQLDYHENIYYLLDKNGETTYNTTKDFIIPIENDIDLSEIPKTYTTYPERKRDGFLDRTLYFDHAISGHKEFISTSYFRELYGSGSSSAESYRAEFSSFYEWDWPVDFGGALSYQVGDTDSYKWNALLLGPAIRWQFTRKTKYDISAIFGVEKSLIFSSRKGPETFSLSTIGYNISLEFLFRTMIGNPIIGLSFRKASVSLKSQNTDDASSNNSGTTSIQLNRRPLTSFAIYVGYGLTTDL